MKKTVMTFEELSLGARFERLSESSDPEETGLIYEKISPDVGCAWGVPEHTEWFDDYEKVVFLPTLF